MGVASLHGNMQGGREVILHRYRRKDVSDVRPKWPNSGREPATGIEPRPQKPARRTGLVADRTERLAARTVPARTEGRTSRREA